MYTTKWYKIVHVFLALCVALAIYPPSAKAQAVVAVQSSASAAILYEPSTGRVLYEKNAHSKRPMASTTKLMTALLAAECLPADATLTASAEALAVIGSSMGLRVGDTVTRDDLLKGLLLSSGNDAANVFALSIAPSFEQFSAMMNDRAVALGMNNSFFVTPSGLDADGHGASAYDMALLAAAVLENELLASICAMKTAAVTVGDRTVTLQNHNKLLSRYPDCVGLKTGFTSLAGRCLVSAATQDGVTLIAVTLNCPNDWEEHETMFEEGFALLRSVELSPPSLEPLVVYGGSSKTVDLSAPSVTVTVLDGDEAHIETAVVLPPYIWAPIEAFQTVGVIEYRLRGNVMATVPITAVDTLTQQERQPWSLRMWQLFTALFRQAIT